jgi:Transposase DDE domain/Domain of unknown function (DUF4372)
MRHENSVFHQFLKHIPWNRFERLVDEYGADATSRRLTAKDQLIALLYGQLSGAVSLREIEAGLKSHQARLYHLGAKPIARSTLADANATRSPEVFSGLFAALVGCAGRGLRRTLEEATLLLDATTCKLGPLAAIKMHVSYDPGGGVPTSHAVTPASVNDITLAQTMALHPGCTYVFDLGYYDYGWWAKMDAQGCRIVTRLRKNTPLTITSYGQIPASGAIVSDRIGLLPQRMARSRKNPFADPVREICVTISTGKVLRLVTNDLDAPAQEIADLYKQRWQIELFFRWVKQNLKIRHFLGVSENAIRIQIAVALIAYLLLRLAQTTQTVVRSPLAFARLAKTNLMHKKSIQNLLKPPPKQTVNPNQLSLNFT